MWASAGRSGLHRYYTIEDGNHVDDRHDAMPTEIRPILPCYREAFQRLTEWATAGENPPANQTVARPASGDVANTCPQLAASTTKPPASQTVARPASGDVANTCPQLAASSTGSKPGNGNGRPR